MKSETYIWMTVVMIFIGIGTVIGFLFLQDQEISALNANSPGNASQYNMLKYTILGAGIGLEILILVRVLMTKLAERPKTKRVKLHVAEPGKKEKKPERLKLRVAEPSRKEKKPLRVKVRAAELNQAEKERRIKGIIETLWKKKGEASMDEIVSAAAKQGIDKQDVEKFLESEKKRGKLALET